MTPLAALLPAACLAAPMQLQPDGAVMRRAVFEALSGTTVTLTLDDIPARAAFDRLGGMLPVPLVGRWRDDALGFGIEPETPITVNAENRPALQVLEQMLDQCGSQGAACTWQIRLGFVELGTKARLSVPAARETRTYYVADLSLEVEEIPLVGRDRREGNALDVVQSICETIEPGQWDYGQEPDESDEEIFRAARELTPGNAAPPAAPPAAPRDAAPPGARRPYVVPTRIAIIRSWRDLLIVHAPDYIHRQIDGYPLPQKPAGGGE
jgi:hypothetical protein